METGVYSRAWEPLLCLKVGKNFATISPRADTIQEEWHLQENKPKELKCSFYSGTMLTFHSPPEAFFMDIKIETL